MSFGSLEVLTVIFVILKWAGIIAWSWWWVFSPVLLSLAIGIVIGAVAAGNGISQGKSREEIMRDIMKF